MITIKQLIPNVLRNQYHSIRSKLSGIIQQFETEFKIEIGKLRRLLLPIPYPTSDQKEINLHLGCGSINHPRFINIDGLPAPHIHHIRQLNNLSIFDDNSVDLIYACHCLEHFSHKKIHHILTEWFRVLKKGGILRISVPDFDLLLNIYKENQDDVSTIVEPLMGGHNNKFDYHQTLFNQKSLEQQLKNVGFIQVQEWIPESCELTSLEDWSNRKIHVNGKFYSVSLNLEAVK